MRKNLFVFGVSDKAINGEEKLKRLTIQFTDTNTDTNVTSFSGKFPTWATSQSFLISSELPMLSKKDGQESTIYTGFLHWGRRGRQSRSPLLVEGRGRPWISGISLNLLPGGGARPPVCGTGWGPAGKLVGSWRWHCPGSSMLPERESWKLGILLFPARHIMHALLL